MLFMDAMGQHSNCAAQPPPASEDKPVDRTPQVSRWFTLPMLAVLCVAFFFYGLNQGDFQKTEGLRAIIAADMLRTGDYLVPMLYEKPLLTKPPVMYAAIAACSLPFGEVTEFSARLPSAASATLTVLLLYWYAARQLGRMGGLIVAAAAPCGFLWLEKGSTAEIDMMQVFWTAAGLIFFFRATEPGEEQGAGRWLWWLAALLAVAAGLLTKWTAPLFFYAAAIPFLFCRGQLRLLWSKPHLLGVGVAAAICIAWAAAVVAQVGWTTLAQTVKQEAEPRLSHAHHKQTAAAIVVETVLHPPKLLLNTLPWSGFALLTFAPTFRRVWDDRGRRLLQAFHCWAWPNLAVMTLLPEHATRHSFPLLPGIAALGAMTWAAYVGRLLPARQQNWLVGGSLVYAGGFILFALLGGGLGTVLLPAGLRPAVLLVASLALGCGLLAFVAWRRRQRGGMFAAIVLSWVVLKLAMVHVYLPERDARRQPRAKAELIVRVVPGNSPLYLIRVKDEGLMFYYRRQVIRLDDWSQLPRSVGPVYCIVSRDEHAWMQESPDWRIVGEWPFKDTQDDSIVVLALVPVEGIAVADAACP